jgi:pimeloyl-ACP methyl ester carboxylesterase
LKAYIRWREQTLAGQGDPHKVVDPMEFGLETLIADGQTSDPLAALADYSHRHLAESERYFGAEESGAKFLHHNNELFFASPIVTETLENNLVTCRLFETSRRERAVVLFPHWNAAGADYDGFARLLRLLGITVLRMTLPYHEGRRPGSDRMDRLMVSANLGRTIRSCRQAILEGRLAIGWLRRRGYDRIGVVGSSLGSSIASIVAAHDQRVRALALLFAASDFGEVVWTGRATRHIRKALDGRLTQTQLSEVWSLISPVSYVPRLRNNDVPTLIVSGREDEVFRPYLTERFVEALREHSVPHWWKVWPCGHYTMGTFPFNASVLTTVARFLRERL